MKRAYLDVVLGLILTGSVAYAQTGMRGSSAGGMETGSRNGGGFVEHSAPASFHGNSGMRGSVSIQRSVGEPRGFSHPGAGSERNSGDRRMFLPSRGDFGDRRVFRGGLFDNGFGRGRGVVVFAYGVPYCYPSGDGYYDSAPYSTPDSSTDYNTDPDTQNIPTVESTNPDTNSYYQPGSQWGSEMKLYHVTMDQLVAYLKSYILSASPVQQAAFRTGFVTQFGADGQAIYDQAVQQAIPQN
jgi:hypothetical protein